MVKTLLSNSPVPREEAGKRNQKTTWSFSREQFKHSIGIVLSISEKEAPFGRFSKQALEREVLWGEGTELVLQPGQRCVLIFILTLVSFRSIF